MAGDGRLNHELLPGEKGPQDACGVFGVWAPGEEVAKLTFYGLYALQHRGQESAGIAVSDGHNITVFKDMGLVSQVFTESALESLVGYIAIGHTRYSTAGGQSKRNIQPLFTKNAAGDVFISIAHNGNLVNSDAIRQRLEAEGIQFVSDHSDTEVMLRLIEKNDYLQKSSLPLFLRKYFFEDDQSGPL